MVSPVHDDDTDYSDLDEEAPSASRRHAGPKNRERLSERTPLLSASPPPPAYADVTRLYGTPPYIARNDANSVQPDQSRHQDATTPAHTRIEEPQSMGDPGRDAEHGKKVAKKRTFLTNRKALACLVFILAFSLVALTTVTTFKHNKSDDSGADDDSPSPADGFPHYMRCNYQSISDRQTFSFQSPASFSFVEITEGSHNPSNNINGQVRILLGAEDQKDPLLMEMRVAKSPDAQGLHFGVDYTGESLRLNAPAYSSGYDKACMEIDMSLWIRPGAQLEHLEIATEHLDIKIDPGLFSPSLEPSSPGQNGLYYISNQTDFITVSGSLSAAYWESGRETRIDVISGSVSGRFALKDLLSIKTASGDIDIDVEPKAESPTAPRPASFVATTNSGSIKASFPMSDAVGEIPPRLYHTKVESKTQPAVQLALTFYPIQQTALEAGFERNLLEEGFVSICFRLMRIRKMLWDISEASTRPSLEAYTFNILSNGRSHISKRKLKMPFNTALTRKLGIKVPVVQGGMMWVGYAELASAVSNAGGLGILTALTQPTPEDLRKEIRKCRKMTSKPFGVNLTLLPALQPPDYPAYARVIIEEGIRIVETAGNNPAPVIKQLKAANPPIIILHKCTTVRHALSAIKLGVDFLSIDGMECAGHVGETDITNFILLSRARQELNVPFIASGGFADGQGLAAALSLGAEGINMGTRFMCTVEAPIHQNIKESIVKAQETDTELVLRRWKNTSRMFSNKVARDAIKIERESPTGKFEEVAPYVSGKRGREVFLNGDPEHGVWTAGQVIGLIHDIPTCADLITRIEREALDTINKAKSLYVDELPESETEGKPIQDPSANPKSEHGTVGPNENNPEAQLWGIGKSKL
ncbi:2-nitropropane dioxygenase [Aureobasidium sp. EXF-10727]|nr:2-nitropropane dioxygenase [Aureobasidium sp. EXF-10727]